MTFAELSRMAAALEAEAIRVRGEALDAWDREQSAREAGRGPAVTLGSEPGEPKHDLMTAAVSPVVAAMFEALDGVKAARPDPLRHEQLADIWHRVTMANAVLGAICQRLFGGEVPVIKTHNPATNKVEEFRPGSPFLIGWGPLEPK